MTHGDFPPSSIDSPFRCRGRLAHDRLPGRGLAGERDQRHARVRDQRRAGLTSPMPCTMLNMPSGTPASVMISGSSDADSGVHSAGLSTTAQPGRERGRELPRLQHERRVPRRDQPGHPGRPAQHVAELAGLGERLLVLRDDHVGEVPEVLRRPRRLPLRLGDRQPGVERLQRRDPLAARLDPVRDPVEYLRPGPGRQPRPRAASSNASAAASTALSTSSASPAAACAYTWLRHRVGDAEGGAADARRQPPADEVLDLLRVSRAGLRWACAGHRVLHSGSANGAVTVRGPATPRPWRPGPRAPARPPSAAPAPSPGPASVSGTSGGLTKPDWISPACASTHLAAAGLVSVKITSVTGCSPKCRSRACVELPVDPVLVHPRGRGRGQVGGGGDEPDAAQGEQRQAQQLDAGPDQRVPPGDLQHPGEVLEVLGGLLDPDDVGVRLAAAGRRSPARCRPRCGTARCRR